MEATPQESRGPRASPTLELECRTCGAALLVAPDHRTAECPYCASPHVLERAPRPDRPRPALALGFTVDAERARRIARTWLTSRGPFAHPGLRRAALENTRGIYLPAYLYSADVRAAYRAEIGEDYLVTETVTSTDGKGHTTTSVQTRTETEWFSFSGQRRTWEGEVLVSASRGLPNDELEAVEPFDLRPLRRYAPAIVAGWLAEEPSVDHATCLTTAREETLRRIQGEVEGFLPGDRQTDVQSRVRVERESAELILLPVWVLAVRYAPDAAPLRLVINGQSGKTAARVPLSRARIALGILGALLLLAAVAFLLVGLLR